MAPEATSPGAVMPPPITGGAPTGSSSATAMQYDQFIDKQIDRTRHYVKLVDIASEMIALVAGVCAFLLLVSLIDTWVLSDGLGYAGRLFFFLLLLGGLGYFLVKRVAPLLLRRISDLYAAHSIEQSKPSFKNSLINFLQFRGSDHAMRSGVLQNVRQRAATELSHTSVEASVDRSGLVRVGYIFLAVLVVFVFYVVLTWQRGPFRSIQRVLIPWSDVEAPQVPLRVSIDNVEISRGQSIEITAEIRGLFEDETAVLHFSEGDGQTPDQQIEMMINVDGEPNQHSAKIVPELRIVDREVVYWIEAGDAKTKKYHLSIDSAPAISVQKIEYEFPAYTHPELIDFTATMDQNVGDIKAIEGTLVTIHAEANHEIESAFIDFDSDGKNLRRMAVRGNQAWGRFRLSFKQGAENEQISEFRNYQLKFVDKSGQPNNPKDRPLIQVTPDYAPVAEILQPEARRIELPQNRSTEIEVFARDQDFRLIDVRFFARVEGGKGLHVSASESGPGQSKDYDSLLPEGQRPWPGQFNKTIKFVPAKYGLSVGDVVVFHAVAVDNKSPKANESTSETYRIQIIEPMVDPRDDRSDKGSDPDSKDPGSKDPPGDGQKGDDQKTDDQADGENPDDKKPGDKKPDKKGQENDGSGDKKDGEKGDDPSDGEQSKDGLSKDGEAGEKTTDDSEAIEKLLESAKKEQQKNAGENGQGNQDQTADQGDEGGTADDKKNDEKKPGDGNTGEGNTGESKSNDSKSNDRGKKNPGNNENDPNKKGNESGGSDADMNPPGEKPNDKTDKPGEKEPGEKEPGEEGSAKTNDKGNPSGDDPQEGDLTSENSKGSDNDDQAKPGDIKKPGENPDTQNGDNGKAKPGESPTEGASGDKKDNPPGEGEDDGGKTGKRSDNKEGSPDSQNDKSQGKRQDKKSTGDNSSPSDNAQSPNTGNNKPQDQPSDSQGDRKGGGKKGGGQSSGQPGTEGDGAASASDAGKKPSEQEGPGVKGQDGGDKEQSDGKTGQSGDEKGNGSNSQNSDGQSGNSNKPIPKGSEGSAEEPAKGGTSGGDKLLPSDKLNQGTGGPGQGQDNAQQNTKLTQQEQEEFERTRRNTELVLRHIREMQEQGKTDEIKKMLKWSDEELAQFQKKYEKIVDDSKDSQSARDKLLGLGLGNGDEQVRAGHGSDENRNVSSGTRVPTPRRYRDRVKSYSRGRPSDVKK